MKNLTFFDSYHFQQDIINVEEYKCKIHSFSKNSVEYLLIIKLREEKILLELIECDRDVIFYRNNYHLEDFKMKSSYDKDLTFIYRSIIEDLNKYQVDIFYELNANLRLIKLTFSPILMEFFDRNKFILYEEKFNLSSIFKYVVNIIRSIQNNSTDVPNHESNSNLNYPSFNFLLNQIMRNNQTQIESNQRNENFEFCIERLSNINLNNRLKNMYNIDDYSIFSYNFSKIIYPEELALFKAWFNNKEFKLDLLYSSEIHGEEVVTFHKKCDGIQNTLVLIYTNKEKRIGGYSSLPWSSKKGFSNGSGEEFLFSLNNKEKYINDTNKDKAIYNNPDYFPTFGSGCDLNLYRDCFDINNSYTYSNFQHSYGKFFSATKKEDFENYFTGENKFRVIRMEVFKVFFKNK